MLRAILNKSWRQHPTRHQLYDHLPPITKTIQVRRTRHAEHCRRSMDELISDVLLWTPHTWPCKSRTTSTNIHSATMRIRDVVQKTCLRRWTIGKSGERGSGISMLPARYDDDDDIYNASTVRKRENSSKKMTRYTFAFDKCNLIANSYVCECPDDVIGTCLRIELKTCSVILMSIRCIVLILQSVSHEPWKR